jgi:Ca-activated chloride channel family protein
MVKGAAPRAAPPLPPFFLTSANSPKHERSREAVLGSGRSEMTRSLWTGAGLLWLQASLVVAGLAIAGSARAERPITLDARLAHAVLPVGDGQKTHLRVGLKGCEADRVRVPVNVAFVIDRSGSMAGERLAQARTAAGLAVARLGADDIASVVAFDHAAQLLVAAQRVSDREVFIQRIERIAAGGSTAIHDGVVLGAGELRKFKDPGRLNRLILLSDGQANVGPRHPAEFAALGAALLAEDISVTTIGLGAGYNEDLMFELARASDGNHAFARAAADLGAIFNREFDDVLGSCAQTVAIDIDLEPGARALRTLSREGTVEGGRASFRLNQVYAGAEHYVLLELELDQGLTAAVGERVLGVVTVSYWQPSSQSRQTLTTPIRVSISASKEAVAAGRDRKVEEAVLEQVTRQRAQQAIKLKDDGNAGEARQLLLQNSKELEAFLATAPTAPARLLELNKQYQALTAPAGKAASERKVLRALEIPAAGSATRY